MRLIDTDALDFLNEMRSKQEACKKLIAEADGEHKTWTEKDHWEGVYGVFVEMALVIKAQPAIEAEPAWKPATIKPKTAGKYLVLWSLTEKHRPHYKLLNYGTFEDWNDGLTEKLGWWEFDVEYGVTDFTDNVRYWTELPDIPEVKE